MQRITLLFSFCAHVYVHVCVYMYLCICLLFTLQCLQHLREPAKAFYDPLVWWMISGWLDSLRCIHLNFHSLDNRKSIQLAHQQLPWFPWYSHPHLLYLGLVDTGCIKLKSAFKGVRFDSHHKVAMNFALDCASDPIWQHVCELYLDSHPVSQWLELLTVCFSVQLSWEKSDAHCICTVKRINTITCFTFISKCTC